MTIPLAADSIVGSNSCIAGTQALQPGELGFKFSGSGFEVATKRTGAHKAELSDTTTEPDGSKSH